MNLSMIEYIKGFYEDKGEYCKHTVVVLLLVVA